MRKGFALHLLLIPLILIIMVVSALVFIKVKGKQQQINNTKNSQSSQSFANASTPTAKTETVDINKSILLKNCITVVNNSLFPDNITALGKEFKKTTNNTDLETEFKGTLLANYESSSGDRLALLITDRNTNSVFYDFEIDRMNNWPGKTIKKFLYGEPAVFGWSLDDKGKNIAGWVVYTKIQDKIIISIRGFMGGPRSDQYTNDNETIYSEWVKNVCQNEKL